MTLEITNTHEMIEAGEGVLALRSGKSFDKEYLTYQWAQPDREFHDALRATTEAVLQNIADVTNLKTNFDGKYDASETATLLIKSEPGGKFDAASGTGGDSANLFVSDFTYNSYADGSTGGAQLMYHELGHAIGGFTHPHRGDYSLPRFENSYNASYVSYGSSRDDALGGRTFWGGENVLSFQIYDIAEFQYLYGANHEFNAGDDVYTPDVESRDRFTIWDGAGNDTLSAENVEIDTTLDLRAGVDKITTVGKSINWVAYGANIENATGGAGHDTIYGNKLNNVLQGNDGNDIIEGYAGDDQISGGAGDDFLSGGAGKDVFTFGTNHGNDVIAAFGEAPNAGKRDAEDIDPTDRDFQIGTDKIGLEGFAGVSAQNVMDFVTEDADGNARFAAEGTTITLFGVSRSELSASDFAYGFSDAPAAPVVQQVAETPATTTLPDTSDISVAKFNLNSAPSLNDATQNEPLIAINIGSDVAFTSGDGTVFAADTTGVGNRYSSEGAIYGSNDETIYKTEAWDPNGLNYAFDLADGTYDVTLHFAEIWQPAFDEDVRVFDITLEDQIRVDQLDIFAESGARTANTVELEVTVTDGELNLALEQDTQNPKLSALEISRRVESHPQGCGCPGCCDQQPEDDQTQVDGDTTAAPHQPLIAINIGADTAFTAADGTVFAADETGVGNRYSSAGEISGTEDDKLYKTESWDPNGLDYAFDLADGNYEVRLHFAEIWNPAHDDGIRVFDIAAEDNLIMDDLDIFAESGGRAAHIVDFDVAVTDGALNLSLIEGIQNPKLSAIEIWKDTDGELNGRQDDMIQIPEMMANMTQEEFAI